METIEGSCTEVPEAELPPAIEMSRDAATAVAVQVGTEITLAINAALGTTEWNFVDLLARCERRIVVGGDETLYFDGKPLVTFGPVTLEKAEMDGFHFIRAVRDIERHYEPAVDSRRVAPWPDFAGNEIREGDMIEHPTGECGAVCFWPHEKDVGDQWRVFYPENGGSYSRLGLQIGSKGMAVVKRDGAAKPGAKVEAGEPAANEAGPQ